MRSGRENDASVSQHSFTLACLFCVAGRYQYQTDTRLPGTVGGGKSTKNQRDRTDLTETNQSFRGAGCRQRSELNVRGGEGVPRMM